MINLFNKKINIVKMALTSIRVKINSIPSLVCKETGRKRDQFMLISIT